MRALLIAQDYDESAILSMVLQRAGLAVGRLREPPELIPVSDENPVDLVMAVTRERLPLAEVKALRSITTVPIIIITEQLDETTQAVALEAGADLVIQRPYSARLLIAQVRALMRRSANLPFYTLPTLTAADVALDPGTRTVSIAGGPPRRLTHLEFRLLYTLMVHRDQVLPLETLIEQVWGYTGEGERDLLRALVRRLRAKVEADPHNPRYILTVPGLGYTLASDL